jgi:hypothetical protein
VKSSFSAVVADDIYRDVPQPCIDARVAAKLLPAFPRLLETFLSEIFGKIDIAHGSQNETENLRPVCARDLREICRIRSASRRSLSQSVGRSGNPRPA